MTKPTPYRQPKKERGPKGFVWLDRQKLRAARIDAGWTQIALAVAAGIPFRTYEAAEQGKRRVSVLTATSIGAALAIDHRNLLRPEDKIYVTPESSFQQSGSIWREYKGNTLFAVFDMFEADPAYVHMVCQNRTSDKGHKMFIRFPVHGGEAEWTYANPLEWSAFTIIKPSH